LRLAENLSLSNFSGIFFLEKNFNVPLLSPSTIQSWEKVQHCRDTFYENDDEAMVFFEKADRNSKILPRDEDF
jgi:hypothetical protein